MCLLKRNYYLLIYICCFFFAVFLFCKSVCFKCNSFIVFICKSINCVNCYNLYFLCLNIMAAKFVISHEMIKISLLQSFFFKNLIQILQHKYQRKIKYSRKTRL